ncbi:MAG: low temperature requirement protein A [Actinobacteria bacterium]|nr:low temperature requirement protein A [Actinomycetota bacterium]
MLAPWRCRRIGSSVDIHGAGSARSRGRAWLSGGPAAPPSIHTAETEDPIRSVHVGMNVIYGVVAGLVVLAAGLEEVLAHAHDDRSNVAGVLVLLGPMIYLFSQVIYFRVKTGSGWMPRVTGATLLGAAAIPVYWLPPYAVVVLLVIVC